jgi:flavin reductase (DIM6/NTAB) family NADH-FMN oxidoreductase RutF
MKIDPKGTLPKDVYQLLIRIIVPRPIAWISTVSREGVPNVAPFSFFTAITADPPTVCFAPARKPGNKKKDTLGNIEATGEFVVNIVTEELAEEMNDTATDYPSDFDEFEQAGLTALASDVVSPPRIAESPVHMECKLQSTVPVGNAGATLVIGEVMAFHVDERVIDNGKVDPGLLRAIGRMGGMDYTRTADRFTLERRSYGDETS